MSEREKRKKELEWADRVPASEREDAAYERTYRDGSAVHECWADRKSGCSPARGGEKGEERP